MGAGKNLDEFLFFSIATIALGYIRGLMGRSSVLPDYYIEFLI